MNPNPNPSPNPSPKPEPEPKPKPSPDLPPVEQVGEQLLAGPRRRPLAAVPVEHGEEVRQACLGFGLGFELGEP